MADYCHNCHQNHEDNNRKCQYEKVPNGFMSEEELIRDGWYEDELKNISQQWDKIDATLFTDRSGSSLIRIKINSQFFYLSFRTD